MKPFNEIHILNGDALLQQFPKYITGEKLVCRECLVVGNLEGATLDEFYTTRAAWLVANYGGTKEEYAEKAITEFEKMMAIPIGSAIHLWFEDDLFCQTNFWFVLYLLMGNRQKNLFLVRPQKHTQYGFAGYDANGLQQLFQQKIKLNQLDTLKNLWGHYRDNNLAKLIETAQQLSDSYPFILAAANAYKASIPAETSLGVPSETLISISKELQTQDFGMLFRGFNKRLPIYGYGDLQVKQLYDTLRKKGLLS